MDFIELLKEYRESGVMMEMTEVTAEDMKTDKINFSFYFSAERDFKHSIRVIILWGYTYLDRDDVGYMKLDGEYEYFKICGNKEISEEEIEAAREFFKKYKVLFAGAWKDIIDVGEVDRYFRGRIDFDELLDGFYDMSDEQMKLIKQAKNPKDLERIVRQYNIYDMYD